MQLILEDRVKSFLYKADLINLFIGWKNNNGLCRIKKTPANFC